MIASLRQFHDWPVMAVADQQVTGADVIYRFEEPGWGARWAKLNLDKLAPWPSYLYLDADTRVCGDLSAGFDILADGWDMAITASKHQETNWLWQASEEERAETGNALKLSLQGGVFYARQCERIHQFLDTWRAQWLRFGHIDQGALIRALYQCPVRLWLLDRTYNDGELIEHRWGRAVR